MSKPYFVTTSIPYANGAPHIGHAFEYCIADAIARAAKLEGKDVWFSSGTDEFGQKNERAAEKAGLSPGEFVGQNADRFKQLIGNLDIDIDVFVRTTDPNHQAVAQWLWQQADQRGDLEKRSYTGRYCSGCEEYKQPDEIDEAGNCKIHLQPVEERTEENWFFKLTNYKTELQQAYEAGQIAIVPSHRLKETLNFLDKIEDISVSRAKAKLSWGVPVPGDDSQVMYVWFDALANYLTASRPDHAKRPIEKTDFARWPADLQIVGKDIFRFHTIIWPALLLSAGLELPKQILIHGFINNRGHKMSKSIGNVVDPAPIIQKYGADALRYYLLRYIPSTDDGDFSDEHFHSVYTADLVNTLGNLVQRTVVMASQTAMPIPTLLPYITPRKWYTEKIAERDISGCLEETFLEFHRLNVLIDQKKPWQLVKTEPENAAKILQEVYQRLYESTFYLRPFLPNTAERLARQLKTGKPEPLFPRLELT